MRGVILFLYMEKYRFIAINRTVMYFSIYSQKTRTKLILYNMQLKILSINMHILWQSLSDFGHHLYISMPKYAIMCIQREVFYALFILKV